MLTPRKKFPLAEAQRRVEPLTLHHTGQRAHILPTELFWPHLLALEPDSSLLAVLVGTINLCHFISLSVTLTLPEGHRASRKQFLLGSFPCLLCN